MLQLVFGVRMNAQRSGCPINLTVETLGDRWSLIVIRDLVFGNRRHFRELLTRLEEADSLEHSGRPAHAPRESWIGIRRDDPCLDNRILLMRPVIDSDK